MIKYDIVVCCYDKKLVNVAAYVTTGYVCVCVCVCVVRWSGVNLTSNYTCSHIYQILPQQHTTVLYFIISIIHYFS